MSDDSFLRTISDLSKIITPIDSTIRFPEVLEVLINKYDDAIDVFCKLIEDSNSSEEVLRKIRTRDRDADERMALLKMYRRCVSPVLDTETTKKIKKILDFRSRDSCYQLPPAQIRTSGIPAYGSYLECLTANRTSGQG